VREYLYIYDRQTNKHTHTHTVPFGYFSRIGLHGGVQERKGERARYLYVPNRRKDGRRVPRRLQGVIAGSRFSSGLGFRV
jgi:hypothetical protein